MKEKFSVIIFIIIILLGAYYYWHSKNKMNAPNSSLISIKLKIMKISSLSFGENKSIPSKFTCDGESINPPLEISGVPAEAKSLALIMDDPDAPMAGGFVHWVVFNMNPKTEGIGENMKPESGIEGTGSSGKNGYVPPCPPSGAHHYHFKLYALDSELNLDGSAKREDIEKAMEGHTIEQAEIIGLYQRQ
jgi:Raf kinase inhibitor-like YbhB/YbcL family protein